MERVPSQLHQQAEARRGVFQHYWGAGFGDHNLEGRQDQVEEPALFVQRGVEEDPGLAAERGEGVCAQSFLVRQNGWLPARRCRPAEFG